MKFDTTDSVVTTGCVGVVFSTHAFAAASCETADINNRINIVNADQVVHHCSTVQRKKDS